MKANRITGANAGGPSRLAMRTSWAARIAQLDRWHHERRTKSWTLVALVLAAIAAVALLITIGPVRMLGEFGRAEAVKGYWASLQEFEIQKGRYPSDDAEIAAFFHTAPGSEPVEYLPPQQRSGDEVVLSWKQKTMFGVQVGITKAGIIVKR